MKLGEQIAAESVAEASSDGRGACVTVGTFDGVHRGHQELLRRVAEIAEADGLRSVALSFRRPPRAVIDPTRQTRSLCDLETRAQLIKALDIDAVCLIDFDDAIRRLTAREFLRELQSTLRMACLVIGERTRVGHDQLAPAQLRELGAELGLRVEVVSAVTDGDVAVSSSQIRALLAAGDVERAGSLLGRRYERGGEVVRGKARAREMGTPTANMQWDRSIAMPANGIYATWAKLPDGRVLPSGTYIGDNPTFGGNGGAFEVYILDFDEDLYGQRISVEFIQFRRGDIKYDSVEDLIAAIEADVAYAVEFFRDLNYAPL